MPITPISPSTAPTGSLGSFVGSGSTSSVFSHDQAGYVTYHVVDDQTLTGAWPNTCTTTKKFLLTYSVSVDEEVFDWNFSSASGIIDTYTCMSATVNSYDSSVGLGTSGYINFVAGGYTQLATATTPTYHHTSQFDNILITSPIGLNNERADDVGAMNSFVAYINTQIRQGGLPFSHSGRSEDSDITVAEYGWEPRLLCP